MPPHYNIYIWCETEIYWYRSGLCIFLSRSRVGLPKKSHAENVCSVAEKSKNSKRNVKQLKYPFFFFSGSSHIWSTSCTVFLSVIYREVPFTIPASFVKLVWGLWENSNMYEMSIDTADLWLFKEEFISPSNKISKSFIMLSTYITINLLLNSLLKKPFKVHTYTNRLLEYLLISMHIMEWSLGN